MDSQIFFFNIWHFTRLLGSLCRYAAQTAWEEPAPAGTAWEGPAHAGTATWFYRWPAFAFSF